MTAATFGQNISGTWYGLLSFNGINLHLQLDIEENETGYQGTFYSLDQKSDEIPVTKITFSNNELIFNIENLRANYKGVLNENNIIEGTFTQGAKIPLNFSREVIEPIKIARADEPQGPFPYNSEDLTFKNEKQNVVLAATLTLPKSEGPFPVAILVTGSSPQDRNEEILGHKPFLKMADYLTRRGIAVLRYDDRGTAESTGNFASANTKDFATDAEAAVAYLRSRKDINKNKIGIIGHSEGGIIAPIVAAKDKKIDFIVLLAGMGIRGDSLLLIQQQLIGKAAGAQQNMLDMNREINSGLYKLLNKEKDTVKLKPIIGEYFEGVLKKYPGYAMIQGMKNDEMIARDKELYTNNWLYHFITFDPSETLQNVKCPVLAINGSKDLQVSPEENLKAIELNLKKGGNKNVTIIRLENMNHLFQETETGALSEYDTIDYSFSEKMLKVVGEWILKNTTE